MVGPIGNEDGEESAISTKGTVDLLGRGGKRQKKIRRARLLVIQASITCVAQMASMCCTATQAVPEADVSIPVRASAGKGAGTRVINRFQSPWIMGYID